MPITTKDYEFGFPHGQDVLDATLYDQVYQWQAACLWFSMSAPVSSVKELSSTILKYF